MGYVACGIISGEAHLADAEELADIVRATPDTFTDYVPDGFAPAVQDYLTTTLA